LGVHTVQISYSARSEFENCSASPYFTQKDLLQYTLQFSRIASDLVMDKFDSGHLLFPQALSTEYFLSKNEHRKEHFFPAARHKKNAVLSIEGARFPSKPKKRILFS